MNVVTINHCLVKITRRNEPKCGVFKLLPWFESAFIFLFYNLGTVIFSKFCLCPSSIIITSTIWTLVNTCLFISDTMTIHLPQSASQLACVFIGWWLRQLRGLLWNGRQDRHICQSGKVGWGGGIMSLDGTSSLARLPVRAMPHGSSQPTVCCWDKE